MDRIGAACCGVEQLVARWAHNPKVGGSNPSPATSFNQRAGRQDRLARWFSYGGVAQAVRATDS